MIGVQRRWLITGASRGIGRLVAERALTRGDLVIATARDTASLGGLKARHSGDILPVALDLSGTDGVGAVVQEAVSAFGGVDVLVSNAGYLLLGAVEECSEAQIMRQLSVNLLGAITVMRAVLPSMRQQRGGRIIQLSSEAGQMAYPALAAYHASKWGLEGFCEALRKEVGTLGIQVSLVEPGRVATDFDSGAERAAERIESYGRTPVGVFQRLITMGRFPSIGDAAKVAEAIIACADAEKAPLRLVLGSDSYTNMRRALRERLADLEAQRETAGNTDTARPARCEPAR